jgi:FkbM family methyltransferase
MKTLIKSIYWHIPFKREIFNLVKLFGAPPESIYSHLSFKGIFPVIVPGKGVFKMRHYGFVLENDIYWTGLTKWETESIKLWILLSERSNCILDIGANTGVFSLIGRVANPSANIFAFEPVERVFKKLTANITLNSFDVTCIDKAVSNADGTATIYDTNNEHTYSVTVNKNRNGADTQVIPTTITTLRLDTFINAQNLPRIDLMKMDVETHEPEVLEGMGAYLAMHKPAMLIEILNVEVGEAVEALVKDKGYLYFRVDELKGPTQCEHILPHENCFNYLLCDPETAKSIHLL